MEKKARFSTVLAAGMICILVALPILFAGCSDDDDSPTGGDGVQVGWYLNELNFEDDPFLNTLEDVVFIDETNGWAVGFAGSILRTTDSGETWEYQTYRTDSWLMDVTFLSATAGWSVGAVGAVPYDGLIISTADGGATWGDPHVIESVSLLGIAFAGEQNGGGVGGPWGSSVGGKIFHTADGGQTWAQQDSTDYKLYAVDFVGSDTGWVVGHDGLVMRTVNGGANWLVQPIDISQIDTVTELATSPFYALDFVDAATGWVVGEAGAIYYTADSGLTWTDQSLTAGDWGGLPPDLSAVTFIDVSIGWIVGSDGLILFTATAGALWDQQGTQTGLDLTGIALVNGNVGWAVGEDGTLLETTTGGR